ncbi:hypothetical protein RHGRI_024578 [Rhododendron griersonianum]|uniref:Uncharacterized protein n=1 Tax=Rhododendron griersonianum TaxID=479676 RepID=A0AAV6J7Z5_9ERIC|nr:hypothetical protein RHGRI_024578 [Rhododendron griersonianum]
MSNSINTQNQTLELQQVPEQNPNQHDQAARQWETMVRGWISMLPEGKTVTSSEVEAWINSNLSFLPDEFKSMPRPELYEWFNSIANSMKASNEDKDSIRLDPNHARFQRTDQWMPVYSWLETLDTDELIKSDDIIDWLAANPEVKEQLYSRHSRYHLMHYIKKCHIKILKRKEKKKGLQPTIKSNFMKAHKTGTSKLPVPLPCSTINNLPKDSELYAAKRNEAFRKYELLLELEKQLSTIVPNRENV